MRPPYLRRSDPETIRPPYSFRFVFLVAFACSQLILGSSLVAVAPGRIAHPTLGGVFEVDLNPARLPVKTRISTVIGYSGIPFCSEHAASPASIRSQNQKTSSLELRLASIPRRRVKQLNPNPHHTGTFVSIRSRLIKFV